LAASRVLTVLFATLLFVAAMPTSAMATHNDHFQNATEITAPELLGDYFDDNSNVGATVQVNEVLFCGDSDFGKTLWWKFTAPSNGIVDITASGIDSVIWLVPFDGTFLQYPAPDAECHDSPNFGVTEDVVEYVFSGKQYYIQIGGYDNGVTIQEGNLDLTVDFFPDTDGDTVLDALDECPSQAGKPSLAGCPDDDDDGVRNSQDRCPSQAGPVAFGGCPDSDGDGKADPDDACPSVMGDLANGCPSPPPRPDADGDGVFDDGPDKCLGENSRARDENNNGCLDLQTFSPTWIFKPGLYFVRRDGRVVLLGVSVRRFGVSGVPKGARVVVTCTRGECRRMSKRANGRVLFGQLRGEDLRAGSKVTIRVTAPGYVGRARVYTVKRNDLSVRNRCLLPGSSRLLTSCSPVR
jgi:hypothetical protein